MNKYALDTKNTRFMDVLITDFKLDAKTGEFTCYANTKNIIDYAGDRAVDGCYIQTIKDHMSKGTMPLMLWMHDTKLLPVGTWLEWTEDDKGLLMKGTLSKTAMGADIETLAKDGAIKKFSIGYRVIKGDWNNSLGCYDLIELDIKEVSWVNFACNDESDLQTIKSKMDEGEMPSKRELQNILRAYGLSKRQSEKVVNNYTPVVEVKTDAWS